MHGSPDSCVTCGVFRDNSGTYCEGIGFKYRRHTIVVDIGVDDNLQGEEKVQKVSLCAAGLCRDRLLVDGCSKTQFIFSPGC